MKKCTHCPTPPVGATHASPGCLNPLETNGKYIPSLYTCRARTHCPMSAKAAHYPTSADAGRRPDPINNPTLRSPGDAGWGHRQQRNSRPPGDPHVCHLVSHHHRCKMYDVPTSVPRATCWGDACVALLPLPAENQEVVPTRPTKPAKQLYYA